MTRAELADELRRVASPHTGVAWQDAHPMCQVLWLRVAEDVERRIAEATELTFLPAGTLPWSAPYEDALRDERI